MINSITLLRTIIENRMIIPSTATAPRKAPDTTARYPLITTPPLPPTAPPRANMTSATPRLAPESTPRIEGPASGLLNTVCSISPDTANAAPAKSAVKACGNRDSNTIKRHEEGSSAPIRMRHTDEAGIDTDPKKRHPTKSMSTAPADQTTYRVRPLFILHFSVITQRLSR